MYQFCCRDCCEDFKRLRGVVSQCEHCKQEKLLHEKIRFSGVEKNFCSEGTQGKHMQSGLLLPALWLGRVGAWLQTLGRLCSCHLGQGLAAR